MPTEVALLLSVVVVSLIFDFLNGFHDSANTVATLIASRAMAPRAALSMAALAHLIGPLLFGTAVAKTVGSEVVDPNSITVTVILAALLSAIIWNILTWYFGIPSSSSHALIGGIVGAVLVFSGPQVINWGALGIAFDFFINLQFGKAIAALIFGPIEGMWKVILALFLSPIFGLVLGALLMRFMLWAARGSSPSVNTTFKRGQIPTSAALALAHGTNDAQKTMGIITMALVTLGFQEEFHVPMWVMLASATAISIGTASGGWRIIHTLGGKIFRVRPIHALNSQIASAGIIFGASALGGPVSTTQVVSSSIVGVGAADRMSKVRWRVTRDIALAWLVTIPATIVLAGLIYLPLSAWIGP
ncbi:MAG: inorganic phosphate transporter [Chloroflexota bacterium]|nr:inorganic phosphate transporter [Chloroflexota bacterium]